MNALTQTVIPIFGLMVIGLVATRVRLMDEAGVRGLVLFVFNFSIPALLFDSIAAMTLPEDLEWGFLIAFYAASFATYGLGVLVGGVGFRRALDERAIFGMAAAFSNVVLMGIPVVLTALGPDASLPMLIIIGFHSATFMPLTVALVQAGRGGESSVRERIVSVFADVLRNPIILGILTGLLVNLAGLPLPSSLQGLLGFLGAAAVPCALFALGASLATYPLRGDVSPAILLTVLKLIVHPLLVWLVARPLLGLDGIAVDVAFVLAAMPSAVNVYLFGARYEAAPGIAARTVLLTTVASVLTLAVVLALVVSP